MSQTASASRRITDEVAAWPGVTAKKGKRGELSFRIGGREIGHLHGDGAAHFVFDKALWSKLKAAGRIVEHPVFPGTVGPAARRIDGRDDVLDVIALMRMNYDAIQAGRIAGL